MAVRIEIDAQQIQQRFARARQNIETALESGLREVGRSLEGKVKDAVRSKMKVRTGNLLKSIGHQMVDDRTLEVGVVRPADGKVLIYAPVQEFGATIRGRPWLAIPIPGSPVQTKAGVGGISASDVRGAPGQFGFTGTFVRRSKAGNLIVFGKKPGGDILPLFVLKRQVAIKPKGYLVPTVQEALPTVQAFLRKKVSDTLAA